VSPTVSTRTDRPPDRLFYAYLALLVWLPLPLASARPWAVAIMEVWVFALAALWLWRVARRRAPLSPALAGARLPLLLLATWLVYGLIHWLPLPGALAGAISPKLHELRAPLVALGGTADSGWQTLAIDPYTAVAAWLRTLAYALVFLLTLGLVDGRRRVRLLGYTLVYSALVQAAYGSLVTLSGLEYGFFYEKFSYRGTATGTFVNRNHLAEYLVMCLAVGIGLLIADLGGETGPRSTRQRLRGLVRLLFSRKMRLRLYLAAMVIALVLTRSRMGNTAFFASLTVAGLVALALWRHATRATVVLLTSLVIVDLFIVGAWFGADKVVERLEQTSLAGEERVEVTEYGFNLWRDYPWMGTGAGSFYAAFPRYRGHDVTAIYHHAHNDYIQFLAEYGVIGMALLGALVLASLGAAVLALHRCRDPLMRGMAFAATMGIVAMLIHSTVEFNLQIPASAATFMVILALGWIALRLRSGNSTQSRKAGAVDGQEWRAIKLKMGSEDRFGPRLAGLYATRVYTERPAGRFDRGAPDSRHD
jgi:O-antigen ligase